MALSSAVKWDMSGLLPHKLLPLPVIEEPDTTVPPSPDPELWPNPDELGPKPESDPGTLDVETLPTLLTIPDDDILRWCLLPWAKLAVGAGVVFSKPLWPWTPAGTPWATALVAWFREPEADVPSEKWLSKDWLWMEADWAPSLGCKWSVGAEVTDTVTDDVVLVSFVVKRFNKASAIPWGAEELQISLLIPLLDSFLACFVICTVHTLLLF